MDNNEAYYKVSYGLYIISSAFEDMKTGYVGNTVFQVTANPPQFAISCSKDNASKDIIAKSGFFSVSVLDQEASMTLISTFGYKSSRDIQKFDGVEHIQAKSGCPIVTADTVAWFECALKQSVDMGTHMLFIGQILDKALLKPNNAPLTYAYYQTEMKGRAPKNAPTYIEQKKVEAAIPPPQTGKYKCLICGYIYDPVLGDEDSGIPPGTAFEDIPDDWSCPLCGAEKSDFEPLDE